jgi:hypothetical protein
LPADCGFNLLQRAGTMLGGDGHELLTVGIAAVYLVEAPRRIARAGDNGSA